MLSATFWAAVVAATLLVRWLLIRRLRDEHEERAPAEWDALATNGSMACLVPHLFPSRYHDEALYGAHVRQVLLHGRPYNPYWRDDRRGVSSWLHDCLAHYLLAGWAVVLGGDLNRTWIVAVAALGGAWFLFLESVFLAWCGRGAVALPLALFFVFFPDVYTTFLDIKLDRRAMASRWRAALLQRGSEVRPHFHRLPSYFLSMFMLVFLLVGAWGLLAAPGVEPEAALFVGLGFGLLVLVHPYEYAFAVGTLAVSFVLSLAWLPDSSWNLALLTVAAAAPGAAYGAVMARETDPQTRADSLEIMGLESHRRFNKGSLVHVAAAAVILGLALLEEEPFRRGVFLTLAGAQLACFAGRNAQVALGWTIQPFHLIPLGSFLGALAFFLAVADVLGSLPWFDDVTGWAAAVLIAVAAIYNEVLAAQKTYKLFGLPRDMEEAFDWVNENTACDDLFLTLSIAANKALPLYTAAKVQAAPPVPNMVAPFSKDKFFRRIAQLLKTCRADVDRFLSERLLAPKERLEVIRRLNEGQERRQEADCELFEQADWFYPYYPFIPLDTDRLAVPDGPVLEARERLRRLAEEVPELQKPYYLWVDRRDRRFFKIPPEEQGGAAVFESPTVSIYAFK